jgi:hypothetical protein
MKLILKLRIHFMSKNILPLYFQSLRLAQQDGDYSQADNLLESVYGFQKKFGSEVLPSKDKVKAEILYNKYDIFKKLYSWYIYAGTLFFVILIVQIFKSNRLISWLVQAFKIILLLLFILHTGGLAARWFISGHAPWSDAYESMIYVAWATQFFGLVFGRKSPLTMAFNSICCRNDTYDSTLELDGSSHCELATCLGQLLADDTRSCNRGKLRSFCVGYDHWRGFLAINDYRLIQE